jgi:hypothetical protein
VRGESPSPGSLRDPTYPRIRLRPKAGFGGQERGEVRSLRSEIGDHGIEHGKTGLRDAKASVVVDDDGALFAQHRDAARIEGAAG